MRLTRVDLSIVRLPLIRPFRTSNTVRTVIEHIVVRVESDDGVVGWGECAAAPEPHYCAETTGTCWHLLRDILVPSVLGIAWTSIEDLTACYARVRGNRFARAGLEMACWDAWGRSQGRSLASMLGGTRTVIESGVSLGIEPDPGRLFELVDRYRAEGYKRIKLKIAPGHDVAYVERLRERAPDLPLQVDANSAYTLADSPVLKRLDPLNLILIEQPLAHDDIVDHAQLQAQLRTPLCLDESVHTAEDVRKAIELGSCRIVNIKVSRLGGLREARRVHDLCLLCQVPVWCGGMHEFGIGRAANVALSSLAGFSLPGDVSGSDKYFAEDLVEPPIVAVGGEVAVPTGPGLGHDVVPERLERHTVESISLKMRTT